MNPFIMTLSLVLSSVLNPIASAQEGMPMVMCTWEGWVDYPFPQVQNVSVTREFGQAKWINGMGDRALIGARMPHCFLNPIKGDKDARTSFLLVTGEGWNQLHATLASKAELETAKAELRGEQNQLVQAAFEKAGTITAKQLLADPTTRGQLIQELLNFPEFKEEIKKALRK